MNVVILMIPIWLIILAGLIVLQIFLSRAKSKLPGLILPASHFSLVVLVVTFRLLNDVAGTLTVMTIATSVLAIFLLNIPTLIYLLIYFLTRRKLINDKNQEIKKMTIQDLE